MNDDGFVTLGELKPGDVFESKDGERYTVRAQGTGSGQTYVWAINPAMVPASWANKETPVCRLLVVRDDEWAHVSVRNVFMDFMREREISTDGAARRVLAALRVSSGGA